ncbi:hypothetical protein [Marivirga sp.]|uniref:hypothetical protein n=1 Tax=Marivirga sp. TaxID=2018662 RepID=UPI002D7F5282|nr:hypothetical protein [Marivirga sp.]HET8860105.1 hypothetical protein [Marivirga sp.]
MKKPFYVFLLVNVCLIMTCYSQSTENLDYEIAVKFKNKNQLDSATKYFLKATDIFIQNRDSVGLALSYHKLASIAKKQITPKMH